MSTKPKYHPSDEQIAYYKENGYLIVPGVISSEECDAIIRIYEGYADKDYSVVMNLDRKVDEIRNIQKSIRLVHRLEGLVGAEISALQSFFIFKRKGTPYADQAWAPHQDNSYPQARPGAYHTINIMLSDHDVSNGGMYIFPGSHKEGLLPFKPFTGYKEEPGTAPGNRTILPEGMKGTQREITIKKGGVLFLHGNVVHGSHANKSSLRSRPMLSLPYIIKGEKFIAGVKAQRMEIPVR